MRRERELKARLAHHVVGGRRERRTRRPPQDVAVVASLEQEGEVRAATVADPLGVDRALTEAVARRGTPRAGRARGAGGGRPPPRRSSRRCRPRDDPRRRADNACVESPQARSVASGRSYVAQEALAEQRSPTRVARATNRSAPGRLPVTKRASNDPLGPRVTRTRRPTCCPFRKRTTASCTPFRFWSTSNSTSMPPSSSLSFSLDVRRPRARPGDLDVAVLRQGRRGEQQGRADRRRGDRTDRLLHRDAPSGGVSSDTAHAAGYAGPRPQ